MFSAKLLAQWKQLEGRPRNSAEVELKAPGVEKVMPRCVSGMPAASVELSRSAGWGNSGARPGESMFESVDRQCLEGQIPNNNFWKGLLKPLNDEHNSTFKGVLKAPNLGYESSPRQAKLSLVTPFRREGEVHYTRPRAADVQEETSVECKEHVNSHSSDLSILGEANACQTESLGLKTLSSGFTRNSADGGWSHTRRRADVYAQPFRQSRDAEGLRLGEFDPHTSGYPASVPRKLEMKSSGRVFTLTSNQEPEMKGVEYGPSAPLTSSSAVSSAGRRTVPVEIIGNLTFLIPDPKGPLIFKKK